MNIPSLALKNIRRKFFRSAALMLSVALVAGLLFAGAISMEGVMTSIGLGSQRLGADLMVVPEGQGESVRSTLIAGRPSVFYMPAEVFARVKEIKGVKQASPQLFLESTIFPCCSPVDAILIGFDPETDFTLRPWLQDALARPLGMDEIIIGRSIPVAKGEHMSFYGKSLLVVGYLADTGFDYIDHGVFMTLETARDMIRRSREDAVQPLTLAEDTISTILVQLESDISPERAAVFVEYEIDGVKAIASQDVIGAVKSQLLVLLQLLAGIGLALWLVTIILIAVVFSLVVNERQREIGLLRSLGAKKRTVFSLITLEAAIIAAIGGVLGLVAGGIFLYFLKDPVMAAFKLPYLWPDAGFITRAGAGTLLASLATGVVAVLYPSLRCSRMEPFEAIRKGE